MARRSIGFLDVKEISSDALLELFADYQADRKSITRGVFGNFSSPFRRSWFPLHLLTHVN